MGRKELIKGGEKPIDGREKQKEIKEGGEKKEGDGGGGSQVGGEGSRDPDRTASSPDLWPARPQDKRKGRAGGWQEEREEEGGVAARQGS